MPNPSRFLSYDWECDPRKRRKTVLTAYLCWLFAGSFGLHRLYLTHYAAWASQLALCVLGLVARFSPSLGATSGLGLVWFVPLAVWLIADLIRIPAMVARHNAALTAAAPR